MPKPVIKLTSFGYLHLPDDTEGRSVPPQADRIEDVRDRLRDPAAASATSSTSTASTPASRTSS